MEPLCLGCVNASNARRVGDCKCFADPNCTALNANVFWNPNDYKRVISAYIRNQHDCGFGNVLSLKEFKCRRTLLKASNSEQHLLLADKRRVVQLLCVGKDIRVEAFSLEPVIDCFPNIEKPQRLIRTLAELYRNRSFGRLKSGWSTEGLRHRDALAAIDKRKSGFSYREIAIFIYGENVVQTDWNNPGQIIKNRIIRSVKRGQRMINGGYKSLLK